MLFSEIQLAEVVCGASDIVELPDQLTSICAWTDSDITNLDQADFNWDSGSLTAETARGENDQHRRDGEVNNGCDRAVAMPVTGTHVSVQTTTNDSSGLIPRLNLTNSGSQHQQTQTQVVDQRYGQGLIQNGDGCSKCS